MSATAPFYAATEAGLLRWQAGQVAPLGPSEAVTAVTLAPGGRVIAARRCGRIDRFGADGELEDSAVGPHDDPITSLVCVSVGGGGAKLLAGTSSGALLESDDLGTMLQRLRHA